MKNIRAFGNWLHEHGAAVFDDRHDKHPVDGLIQTYADLIQWLGFLIKGLNWPATWSLLLLAKRHVFSKLYSYLA